MGLHHVTGRECGHSRTLTGLSKALAVISACTQRARTFQVFVFASMKQKFDSLKELFIIVWSQNYAEVLTRPRNLHSARSVASILCRV